MLNSDWDSRPYRKSNVDITKIEEIIKMTSKNSKILLMSATPMMNLSPEEEYEKIFGSFKGKNLLSSSTENRESIMNYLVVLIPVSKDLLLNITEFF